MILNEEIDTKTTFSLNI